MSRRPREPRRDPGYVTPRERQDRGAWEEGFGEVSPAPPGSGSPAGAADELGLHAATLPVPGRHPWSELWPSFATVTEYAPGRAGPVCRALQPLREEIAAIPPYRNAPGRHRRRALDIPAPQSVHRDPATRRRNRD